MGMRPRSWDSWQGATFDRRTCYRPATSLEHEVNDQQLIVSCSRAHGMHTPYPQIIAEALGTPRERWTRTPHGFRDPNTGQAQHETRKAPQMPESREGQLRSRSSTAIYRDHNPIPQPHNQHTLAKQGQAAPTIPEPASYRTWEGEAEHPCCPRIRLSTPGRRLPRCCRCNARCGLCHRRRDCRYSQPN